MYGSGFDISYHTHTRTKKSTQHAYIHKNIEATTHQTDYFISRTSQMKEKQRFDRIGKGTHITRRKKKNALEKRLNKDKGSFVSITINPD